MGRNALVLVVVAASVCFAAPPPEDFALKAELVGGTNNEVLVVGSWTADEIQGWSWGLRHDPAEASIDGCVGMYTDCGFDACTNVVCPEDMQTPGPAGESADFNSLNVYDEGATQGIVLSLLQKWNLDATARFEMIKITYTLEAGVDCLEVAFAGDLGDPPIDTTFVVGGVSITPATQTGLTCEQPCSPLAIAFGDPVVSADPCGAAVPVLLTTDQDQAVSGFQFGVMLDTDTADARIDSVDEGADLIAVMAPDPVEYFVAQEVDGGKGVVVGGVPELVPEGDPPVFRSLPACTDDQEIAVLNIVSSVASVSVTASFENALGDPPKDISVDVDGETVIPDLGDPVTFTIECEIIDEPFVRGDANQDLILNVSDAVAIAKAVFNQGSKLPLIQQCRDSADVNDDGVVDTTDAVYLLAYLFELGPVIPAPTTCGNDPTPDELDCPDYPPCPR
jgi:hypothetical protein